MCGHNLWLPFKIPSIREKQWAQHIIKNQLIPKTVYTQTPNIRDH